MECGDPLESLFAVGRRFDVESPAANQLLEAHTGSRIVFDDEDPFAGHCYHTGWALKKAEGQRPSALIPTRSLLLLDFDLRRHVAAVLRTVRDGDLFAV